MRLSTLTSSRLSTLSEQIEKGFEDVRRRLDDPHPAPNLEHGADRNNRLQHHAEVRTADEDTERAPGWGASHTSGVRYRRVRACDSRPSRHRNAHGNGSSLMTKPKYVNELHPRVDPETVRKIEERAEAEKKLK